MGIKGFSKLFTPKKTINLKELKGSTIIVDAMIEIYRAERSNLFLKGNDGSDTSGIKIIIDSIIKRKSLGITEIWCFDYLEKGYRNPMKILELNKRKTKTKQLINECNNIRGEINDMKNNDNEIDDVDEKIKSLEILLKKKEKNCKRVKNERINEYKFILKCLNIDYIETPKGYEAECICAYMNIMGYVDFVFSNDYDAILFGSKKVLRRIIKSRNKNTKNNLLVYDLNDILTQHKNINNMDLLIKTGIILGTDFYHDKNKVFNRIGPQTIKKNIKSDKIQNIFKNNPDIMNVVNYFKKYPNINDIKWYSDSHHENKKKYNIKKLLNWLINIKGFNKKSYENKILKLFI